MEKHHPVELQSDGADIFVLYDGKKIAKRGRPGTPQAGTWISLEPGWSVTSTPPHDEIVVEHNGVPYH